jgi:hypothetical protein
MRFVSLVLLFMTLDAVAQIRPFQTTRLHSTGGAGVASMLVTESAVLNPAPLAFFADTFVSYQNTRTSIHSDSEDRESDDRVFPGGNRSEGYFLFDNASSLKGGFSYQTQRENGFNRKRGTATMAAPIGENMSYGLLYRYTEDSRPDWYGASSRHKVSHPFTMGLTWIPYSKLTVGFVWDDPTRAITGESRAIAGLQYSVTPDLIAIIDAGGDPTTDFYDKRLWRGALQFNVFSDFFLRGGKFQDRALNLEGEAWGVSWTGPKLGVDFAMKTSRQIQSESGYLYKDEKLQDVSFTANVRF